MITDDPFQRPDNAVRWGHVVIIGAITGVVVAHLIWG